MLRSGSSSPRMAGVIPKTLTPAAPINTPVTPPSNPSKADSHNTMRMIRPRRQPSASKTHISCVRSNTAINIVFITPSTPTSTASKEVPQLMACTMRYASLLLICSLATTARPSGTSLLISSQRSSTSLALVDGVTRMSIMLILSWFPVISWKIGKARMTEPFSTHALPSTIPTTDNSLVSIWILSPTFFFSTSAAVRPRSTAGSAASLGMRPEINLRLFHENPPHSRADTIIIWAFSMLNKSTSIPHVASTWGR